MSMKIDRMRFQLNSLSYKLGLLGFLLYVAYVAATMDIIPKKMTMGLEIVIHLAFFMVLFLGIEKVKNYSVRWSMIIITLGISSLLRIFWHPLVIYRMGLSELAVLSGGFLFAAGFFLILCGTIGLKKSLMLDGYLKKTGNNSVGIKTDNQ